MSSLSKGFAYIVNTTQEHQKVAKSLSGWDRDDITRLPNYISFDPIVLKRVVLLQDKLFRHATSTRTSPHALRVDVLEVFTTSVVMHVA